MQHVCMFPDRSTLHEEYHAFKVAKRILRTTPPYKTGSSQYGLLEPTSRL